MNVFIIASKGCSHCTNFKRELEDLNINFEIKIAEDNPSLVEKHQIRHSPNLIVDDVVIFRHQPTEGELKEFFRHR